MEKNNSKAWLYLIPAILFLGVFMIYPLVDVLIYSFEEGYNFASQSYSGIVFIIIHMCFMTLILYRH